LAGAASARIAAGLAIAALVGATLFLYWHAVAAAVGVWYVSPTFNHGFIVIPVTAYLIWERRELVRGLVPRPSLWGLPLVAASALLWLFAYAIGVLEAQQFALMFVVEAALLTILGWQIYSALLFPLLFLLFLVPSGDFLVPYLQDFTALFSVELLRLSGIPVYSDGVYISIPNGNFYVAEACAGLRFLIATIAFGFLFAALTYRSLLRRALFIALCLVVPVIANGFRAYGIIMIAHLSDNALAVGVDHLVYGWFFFSLVTLALIGLGLLFRDEGPLRRRSTPAEPARRGDPRLILAATLAALVIAAAPRAYAAYVELHRASPPSAELLKAPEVGAPWRPVADADDWRPLFATADARLLQAYSDGRRTVRLFIAYYRDQNQQKKLIAFDNRVVDGEAWDLVGRTSGTIRLGDETLSVPGTRITGKSGKRLVYSWYWIPDRFLTSVLRVKLMRAKAAFLDGHPEGAFLAIAADYGDDPTEAARTIADFSAQLPPLGPMLREAAR
jgi:exosortase A